jgi:hypothetical protein
MGFLLCPLYICQDSMSPFFSYTHKAFSIFLRKGTQLIPEILAFNRALAIVLRLFVFVFLDETNHWFAYTTMASNQNTAYSPLHNTFQIVTTWEQLVVLKLMKSTKYILYGMICVWLLNETGGQMQPCVLLHPHIYRCDHKRARNVTPQCLGVSTRIILWISKTSSEKVLLC